MVIFKRILVSFVFCLSITSCTSESSYEYLVRGETMGTTYSVKMVFAQIQSSVELAVYESKIESVLERVDYLMSTYREDSEVSILNNLKENQSLSLSSQTYEVLLSSQELSKLTNGFFDITVGPLVNLWGFGPDFRLDSVPNDENILAVKERVNWKAISLSEGAVTKSQSVYVDLSAIAKGYAVDSVAKLLKLLKVNNFLVEVGGEISVLGLNKFGKAWILGIEQPNTVGRKAYTTISLTENSLATSGDYRNYFEKDGRRYSHTINPKTGYPVEHNLASVSVIANTCMESDALATALMAMGEVEGYQFALKQGINAYFIYREGDQFKTVYTPGFKPFLN